MSIYEFPKCPHGQEQRSCHICEAAPSSDAAPYDMLAELKQRMALKNPAPQVSSRPNLGGQSSDTDTPAVAAISCAERCHVTTEEERCVDCPERFDKKRITPTQFWCEHIGGLGPPFPFCKICSERFTNAPGEKARSDEPVCWWNGFRKYDAREGTYPQYAEREDSNHDIPLYAGVNPCNLPEPSRATNTREEPDFEWWRLQGINACIERMKTLAKERDDALALSTNMRSGEVTPEVFKSLRELAEGYFTIEGVRHDLTITGRTHRERLIFNALLAPVALSSTAQPSQTDKASAPGWYWWNAERGRDDAWQVVFAFYDHDGASLLFTRNGALNETPAVGGAWVGPFALPGHVPGSLSATPGSSTANVPDMAAQELQNLVNAKRFDREIFEDDTAFADWALSRCRYTLIDIARSATAQLPAGYEYSGIKQVCEVHVGFKTQEQADAFADALQAAAQRKAVK